MVSQGSWGLHIRYLAFSITERSQIHSCPTTRSQFPTVRIWRCKRKGNERCDIHVAAVEEGGVGNFRGSSEII
jgi:hypothetical protein